MAGQFNETLSLTDILRGEHPPSPPETKEHMADAALSAHEWQRALEAYEHCKDAAAGLRVSEKRGWCLGKKQAWTEALAVLVPHRNELSSAGLTMLAVASVGGWDARYKRDDSARAEFDAMLAKALEDEAPAYLTYAALFWFRHYRQDEEVLLAHARKAVSLYPDEPYLRLKFAGCLRRKQNDEAEICAVLKAGLGAYSTTEYLWTYAESASHLERWDDALAQLERALAMTQADGDRSHQTVLQMRLARAELLVSAGRPEEAVKAYRELALMDMSEAGYIVQSARRALLAVACRAGEDEQIRQALKEWLAAVMASLDRYQISDLLLGECEPIYFFDGDVGSCVSGESLIPHRERLLKAAEDNERGLVRFLFAECERESDDYDPQAFAKSMLQAEKETSSPIILGALATAYAVKKHPNWRFAGSAWARHELHRLSGNTSTYPIEPLSEDAPPSDKAIEAYAKGMHQEFEAVAPSPHLAEISATLRGVLVDKKMYRVFRDIAELVASGSDDPDVIFDAALGAHWCKDQTRAIELYWEVLSRNKAHYSALHNLLLLYRSPKNAVDVERVAKLVEVFPTEDSERRSKLLGVLNDARAACRDPQEVARNVVHAELRRYPALIQGPIKATKVPLQSAVTLITLMEMCESVEGDLVYQPFGGCSALFSPTTAHRQGLFRLLEAGWVAVADDTPVEAFNVKDGKVRGYYFDKIWWRVSPATISLAHSIKEVASKSVWPRRWCEEVMPLAETIAEEECFQYVVHAAESRNWPIPDDDPKVHALAKSLAQHVSVSEAFYLIYLGAMAASDHRQRYPVSTQQTSNLMVLRASQKLDRWLTDPWPLKKYSRSKEVPRSEMSRVLYEEFLRVGERGFSEPVGQLPYPKPRKSGTRSG